MPSIVPFGKFFCRFFVPAKFPRDFHGFRRRGTRLLCSIQARSRVRNGIFRGPGAPLICQSWAPPSQRSR